MDLLKVLIRNHLNYVKDNILENFFKEYKYTSNSFKKNFS